MLKKKLLLGAAVAALGLIPVTAQADQVSVEMSTEWDNEVDVEIEWNIDVDKFLDIDGDILIDGNVDADALAHATVKNDQILDRNRIEFEDYQNAFSGSEDDTFAEPDLSGTADDFEGAPTEATYTNTVTIGADVTGTASGNIGINLVAGDNNLQENSAALASADTALAFISEPVSDGALFSVDSGGAEAAVTALQNLFDNAFNTRDDETTSAPGSYEVENTDINNTVSAGGFALTTADGNIGLNAAAGAFNIQKNAMAVAVVNGGNLAEAVAAVIQDAEFNDTVIEDVNNVVDASGSLASNATGNIGINLAAGVGNLQVNALAIASAFGGGEAGPVGPGPAGPGPAGPGPAGPGPV